MDGIADVGADAGATALGTAGIGVASAGSDVAGKTGDAPIGLEGGGADGAGVDQPPGAVPAMSAAGELLAGDD